jgi:PKD repeat protein
VEPAQPPAGPTDPPVDPTQPPAGPADPPDEAPPVEPTPAQPTEAFTAEVTGPSIAVRAALPAGTDDATVTCTWGFGDGDVATGTSAVHTYPAEGTYVVTLTVTSESGATSTASRTIDVGAAAGTPQGADGRDGAQPAPAP